MAEEHYFSGAVWSAEAEPKTFAPLQGDIEVDVAIVGGGITGLSTAYHLAKAGKRVVVLEAFKIGKGTTGSSTGNLYAPIDERLFSIGSKHGDETMRKVAESRMAAIAFMEQRVQEYGIQCDFQRVPFYLFTTMDSANRSPQVEKEHEAALKAGLPAGDLPPADFPFRTEAFTGIREQAQFNPLSYVQQFAAAVAGGNCQICEETKVENVHHGSSCVVETNRGSVRAEKVVMATHSPKGVYSVHTAMEPYREYVLAVKIKGDLPKEGIYWHVLDKNHNSIRPYSGPNGNYLLVLGEPHKVGTSEQNQKHFKEVEEYLRKYFDVESVEYTWAAQNYKPADNLPYIGKAPTESNIYIATGFAADGLVYGSLAGGIISDDILGKENPWAEIYSPTRFTPVASAKKFAKENISVASHLLKDYISYGEVDQVKEINKGEGKTLTIDDERVAAYRDEDGKLHVVSAVCTHMGCIVHWNNAEKSWDCPCHGSRFSVDGEVLEGPAYDSLAGPDKGVSPKT